MFSIYYIASESNQQVCLWLPYNWIPQSLDYLFFPILLRAAWQCACRDDVCSAVYRYYFCTNCTNTQCLLPALKVEGRFASWVILIGCAKTHGPITGNITGSFCIFLLANRAWPSYHRIARSISNKNWHTSVVVLITRWWAEEVACSTNLSCSEEPSLTRWHGQPGVWGNSQLNSTQLYCDILAAEQLNCLI